MRGAPGNGGAHAQRSDGKILEVAVLLALTAHIAILVMPWKKEPYVPEPPVIDGSIPIIPYEFEVPERPARNVAEVKATTRRVPVPSTDPDQEMLEPMDEEIYVDQRVALEAVATWR